jgi:hypothetical protein
MVKEARGLISPWNPGTLRTGRGEKGGAGGKKAGVLGDRAST